MQVSLPASPPLSSQQLADEVGMASLTKTFRVEREQAEALVGLIEETPAPTPPPAPTGSVGLRLSRYA